ncbi:TPA: hypothetical protein J1492_004936 [Escherichia coli]|nr:hypothetical protein [Escherichia coli]HAZ3596119.1 hypothetical protein [Escherichia coli]HAZ3605158.1 hypothetical protein [Escherichia coli]HAZ3619865.1 hypothetical protein [Escherichia coli]HAZ3780221.1 hypothetical protein [Escherichia coli]
MMCLSPRNQQRLQQASDARAQEVAGGEVLYSGDANLTDEQIAKLPFALYRQGYEYYSTRPSSSS